MILTFEGLTDGGTEMKLLGGGPREKMINLRGKKNDWCSSLYPCHMDTKSGKFQIPLQKERIKR